MIDLRWGLLIVGFVFGVLFAIGCVVAYLHEWNEENAVVIAGAYWQGFDDGWSKCGCGQGSGGSGSNGGGGRIDANEWNWTNYPAFTENT